MDTENMYAWAAGILDADGTITIKRCKRNKSGRFSFIPLIQFSQANATKGNNNVERFKEMFGGNSHISKNGKNIDIISWQATSKTAAKVANHVGKYMCGKKRQIDLLQEYIEKFHNEQVKFHHISNEEMKERENYFNKMRFLQEKGALRTYND